jgi:hypothetical protein
MPHSIDSVRIRRLAMTVRWVAVLTMATMAITSVYSLVRGTSTWTLGSSPGVLIKALPSVESAAADSRIALWLEVVPQIILLYGFARLVQMMRACERGEMFTLSAADHLRGFSGSIVIAQILSITLPLQIAAIHALSARGHMTLSLEASGEQLWTLLIAVVFLVLAQILQQGARLAEDNASIV